MTAPVSDVCWVGPLGQMLPLPDVKAQTDVPVERIGSIHRALAGGLTVDTFARKRSWSWKWEMLLEKQVVFLEALQYGTVPGPLRLIDPRRLNRLPEDIASGGSVSRSNTGFGTDSGSFAYWHPLTDATTADPSTLPAYAMLRGFQEWQIAVPSAGGNFIRIRDDRYVDGRWRVPVLPGETLRFSLWALGPTSAQVTMGVGWYNAAGARFQFDTAVSYTPLALNTWTGFTADVAAPAGAVAAYVTIETNDTHISAGDSVFLTALSVTSPALSAFTSPYITEHCDIPEPSGGWRLGGGAPYVVADVGANSYGELGFYGSALTLYET